jgi:hypothetical protein
MIPDDFKDLLPHHSGKSDERPHTILWVFDPEKNETQVDWRQRHHPADWPSHNTMAPETLRHPHHQRGYAIPIENGWRVMDHKLKPVDDPFVTKSIQRALRHSFPPDLPKVLPHGDPLKHQRH